jgi:hypothetical protein
MHKAMAIFEDSIATSDQQMRALRVAVPALAQARDGLDEVSFDTLASKCKAHAGRMLRRADQVRALVLVSQVWSTNQGSQILDTLQRAIKTSSAVTDVGLKVDLLEQVVECCIWHFGRGVEEVLFEKLGV